ncbi:MAG: FecR domain-containing protein [Chthoniobacterales bacterium]
MKRVHHILVGALVVGAMALGAAAESPKEARVTQIIREVKLLPSNAVERDALMDDTVAEDTGVRTGGESRSELTFADLTITRLGANTIFSFNKAGRTVKLDSGSVLLRVPKDSGGGVIRNNVVTVAVTGTTVILETTPDGASRLITLEGTANLSFTRNSGLSRKVRAAQMLDVPAGATTLPMPVNIDLGQLMRTHPLIVDFQPLPSLPLITAVINRQPASSRPPPPPLIVTGPPSSGGPPTGPNVGPPPTGPNVGPPPIGPGTGGSNTGKPPPQGTGPHPIIGPSPTPSYNPTPTSKPTPTATVRGESRPSPTPLPKASPTATVRGESRPTPTPAAPPKPSPTPQRTPRPSPSPKPSPKPTPKPAPSASPKRTRPPVTNQPAGTKPPVLTTNPTPTPAPVILRTAPKPTPTPSKTRSTTVPRQKTTKKPPPGPR